MASGNPLFARSTAGPSAANRPVPTIIAAVSSVAVPRPRARAKDDFDVGRSINGALASDAGCRSYMTVQSAMLRCITASQMCARRVRDRGRSANAQMADVDEARAFDLEDE